MLFEKLIIKLKQLLPRKLKMILLTLILRDFNKIETRCQTRKGYER
jgi:hypothetical protein